MLLRERLPVGHPVRLVAARVKTLSSGAEVEVWDVERTTVPLDTKCLCTAYDSISRRESVQGGGLKKNVSN